MAQPQQQYTQRAFSPLQSVSPSVANHPPFGPNKRQRLSPNPQSPYSSPGLANIHLPTNLPNQIYSQPFSSGYGAQLNGTMPPNVHHAQTPSQSGAMGPPSRPVDNKPTDMNELADVLISSGVDLKAEEAALLNRFNAPSQQQSETSFSTKNQSSFSSFESNSSGGNIPPSVNVLSPNVPGDRSSFYGAGTFSQPPGPYQSRGDRAESDRKRTNKIKLERRQYHLNDPFLLTGWLQRRLTEQAHKNQVIIPTAGLLSSTNQSGQEVAVAGPDKHEMIVTLKGEDLLYHAAPLVEILTLLSLAAEERLRAMVEDAATCANGRRIGSHGIVPADLADLAVGSEAFESVTALPTPGNSAVSPKSNPLKRSYASMNKPPTPVSSGNHTPTSVVFPNPVAEFLRKAALAERAEEEERLAKRARRVSSKASTGDGIKSGNTSVAASAPGTPGLLGERAPDVDIKRGSKKEQKRQAEAKATEAQQHASTTQTMNRALGISGSLGKKLSWMESSSGRSQSPMLPKVNTSAQGASKSSIKTAAGTGSQLPIGRKYGEFREDKATGAGIQLRDLISVMEADKKERKALQWAYSRFH
ncbi:hypothetical protein MMC22_003659 [Lobaria immixta]|nr:hypothetical protein [Lobaria immixta]